MNEPQWTYQDIVNHFVKIIGNGTFTVETINESILLKMLDSKGIKIPVEKSYRDIDKDYKMHLQDIGITMNEPQLSAEMRKHCMCERCKDGVIHAACCAVHNMPAEPNGECDCEPETPAFSEDLSYYWQRILGEDWTNNQPLYELYLWVVKELATALEEQRAEMMKKVVELNKKWGAVPNDFRHWHQELVESLNGKDNHE